MFYHRSPALAPSVTAIQQHLGAVEQELEKIGHIARRRGSAAASAASEQIGNTISSVLGNMLERISFGGQAARKEAARFGNSAVDLGTNYGNSALSRLSANVEDRPLITLSVAIGIGVLIGAALLGSVNGEAPGKRGRKRRQQTVN
jgi:ElaB/YqjD/DUF883 family membrane-anchored ribosome-binding protein